MANTTILQQYTNHVCFVIDKSGSMRPIKAKVIEVFNRLIKSLRAESEKQNQETRLTVYLFNEAIEVACFDMDVMRDVDLGKIYKDDGGTALLDATGFAIEDLKKIHQDHGDHAFLCYVITDGEENKSRKWMGTFQNPGLKLSPVMKQLPDNWTMACLVPNREGQNAAVSFGFDIENTKIWNTSAAGVEALGRELDKANAGFMKLRSSGIRKSDNLFALDLKGKTKKIGTLSIPELAPRHYRLLKYHGPDEKIWISKLMEDATGEYRQGYGFYELWKPEVIQPIKKLAIRNQVTGKVYFGDKIREILGLPSHEIKVSPGDHAGYDIFVQSTAANRGIFKDKCALVFDATVAI